MPRKNPPLLFEGGLSKRVFVATRYRVRDAEKGLIEAQEKFDVTDQFEEIAARRAGDAKGGGDGGEDACPMASL